jgi:hypothetical protein
MGYRQTPTKENHARVIKHLTCFRHLYLLLIARKVGFAQNRRRPAHLTSLDHLILQELQSWLVKHHATKGHSIHSPAAVE